jgi:isoleucyl-tRNA synthetase
VTTALEGYEPLDAASALAGLVDDLSNWYVRRSRRRFWRTDPDAPAGDTLAAQATLHDVLTSVSLLLAPFCPFVADAMWRALCGRRRDAVRAPGRLAGGPEDLDRPRSSRPRWRWPAASPRWAGPRAARPGSRCASPFHAPSSSCPPDAPAILHDIVAEELNVDEIDVADELSEVLEFELVPNFRTLGPRLRTR